MLRPNKKYKHVILIGSTSEIGIAVINQLKIDDTSTIHLIGRKKPDRNVFINFNGKIEFQQCDFRKTDDVLDIANKVQNFNDLDLAIIAVGVLPKEDLEFDLVSLNETLLVNSLSSILLVSSVAKKMHEQSGGQILICSSVASIRPRIRNFSYGSSKSALDFYAVGLQNKLKKSEVRISILRPGYVFTKMTTNFKPAPFSTKLDVVAKITVNGLLNKRKIIYAPRKLKIIMNIVRVLPRSLFNKLG